MIYLYISCFIPVIIGLVLWVNSREVNWVEWAAGSAVAFLTAGITHWVAFSSQTGDIEKWSGQIVQVRQYSEWREYYEEAVYRTETRGSGKNKTTERVFDHWEPERRTHEAYWQAYSNINTTHDISKEDFLAISKKFKSLYPVEGTRHTFEHASRMIGGDPNDYVSDNRSGVVIPINVTKSFTNRIKASRNVFTFQSIPKDVFVFDYPKSENVWVSDRLLGTAKDHITTLQWDQFNAVLGPVFQVNLIMVGFPSQETMLAEYQKAKWVGGKKNDLVLCYGKGWSKVFGWSDSNDCKRAIEAILLEGPVDATILPKISKALSDWKYTRKNWHDFDYLSVEPNEKQWSIFLVILFVSQLTLYIFFHSNNVDKHDTGEEDTSDILPNLVDRAWSGTGRLVSNGLDHSKRLMTKFTAKKPARGKATQRL